MSRFDWYATTLSDDSAPSMAVAEGLIVLGDKTRRIRGQYGYSRGIQIFRDGDVWATCYDGPGRPDFVVASGHHAPSLADSFRQLFPNGSVSRADACIDFAGGAEFYDQAHAWATDLFHGKIKMREFMDLSGPQPARTLYLGSPKSETQVRIYQKGLQDPTYPIDTVRAEVQVRPQKPTRKRYAAVAPPQDLWGFSRFSKAVIAELASVGVPAAPPRSARVSDLDRALDAAVTQYRRIFLEHLERLDGDVDAWSSDLLGRMLER